MQFLMIARPAEGIQIEQILPFAKPEAAKTWEYYASGLVRSIHYIADASGVVLLWEAPSLEALHEAIAQLPMHQAGVLKLEIIPLKPYTGFEPLFAKDVSK